MLGTLLAFQMSEADASVLERQFGGNYGRAHFLGLDSFELCARLLNREPFLAKSLPPLETARRRSKLVNRHSGQKYCKQQKHVQEKIEHWLKRGH